MVNFRLKESKKGTLEFWTFILSEMELGIFVKLTLIAISQPDTVLYG